MSDDTGKQRLRPFLEAQINSGKIEGLRWLNDQRTKFRIPWFHGGKPDWSRERSQVFKEWAIHTGRYREGVDEEDWVNWKTRLRCALNKAPNIVECKNESCVKGEDSDPYKVYEFRPRQSTKKKATTGNSPLVAGDATVSRVQGVPGSAPFPKFLNNYELASDDQIQERMPSDLYDVHTSDLVQTPCEIQVSQMSFTEADASTFNDLLDVQLSAVEASNHLELELFYSNNNVWRKHVENPNGFRIYYGDEDAKNQLECFPVNLLEAVFGENQAETFWLPPVQGLISTKMAPHVQQVLERGMRRGVLIQCHDSDIVAYRLCKCSVFYASAIGTNGDPIKLPLVLREKETESVEPTTIFDYKNCFLPALNRYVLDGGPAPDPRVHLLIGSAKKLSEIGESVPIYATVASSRALHDLRKVSSAMAQNRQPVQRFDVDDVVNDVQHMSLESVEFDMTTGVTAEIPGYCLVPEPDLLPGNFIDPSTFEEPPGLPSHFNFAADQNVDTCNQFEVGSFPADVDLWSQLDTRSDEAGTIDMNEFADLIHFQ